MGVGAGDSCGARGVHPGAAQLGSFGHVGGCGEPLFAFFFFLPICLSKFHESLQLLYLSWFWFLLHSLVHKMLCDFHMCVMG